MLPFRLLEALDILPAQHALRGKISTRRTVVVAHRPNFRVQRLANLSAFVKHVTEKKGVKLVNIGAEDLEVGNNEDLVLGMTWALIKFYEFGQSARAHV